MVSKKGELSFGSFLTLFSFMLVIVLVLLAFNFYSLQSNPQDFDRDYTDLTITGNTITGNALGGGSLAGSNEYVERRFTIEEIQSGVDLEAGWHVFVWPEDSQPYLLTNAFSSILTNMYFSYAYGLLEYWFNSNGPYADYNHDGYYSEQLFDKVYPGEQYGVYLARDAVLQFDFPDDSGDGAATVISILQSCEPTETISLTEDVISGEAYCLEREKECVLGTGGLLREGESSIDPDYSGFVGCSDSVGITGLSPYVSGSVYKVQYLCC